MGREDSLNGYLPPSTTQRRPKGGVTRFDTGSFGTDVRAVPSRITTFAGRVRDAMEREVREVLDGYEHQPADAPRERQFELADTGSNGLNGHAALPEKNSENSRRKKPYVRERGGISPQSHGRR